jgi:hypothetical protein
MPGELPLTGGCGCGAVRFAVDAPLVGASYCHCTRCQHRTGAAAGATGRVEPGSARITAGAEHVRDWIPDGGMGKSFCVLCGCGVFGRKGPDEPITGVRLGALDADPGVRPAFRQFVDYAASWEPIPDDGLPHHPEAAPR